MIINSCNGKEDFIKRKIDEILNHKNNKEINGINYNSQQDWKIVDKGGKYKYGKKFNNIF
jgi:hypothetical protein